MLPLAQLIPDAPKIPPLPGAPIWERALLEQPAYLAGTLIVGAIVAFMLLNQKGKMRQGIAAAVGLVLVASGVLVLGAAVQTQREQMSAVTRSLVAATARGDPDAVGAFLAPDARLYSGLQLGDVRIAPDGLDRGGIVSLVQKQVGDHPLEECSIQELQAEALGPGTGRTQVRVRVVSTEYKVPEGSWWRITWRKAPDGRWQATSIEPLWMQFAAPVR